MLKNEPIGSPETKFEIERKFIVDSLPSDIASTTFLHVRQGYLAIEEKGNEIRIRQKGTVWTMTLKRGSGLVRQETEIRLTEEQFTTLWPLTEGRRIQKNRYRWTVDSQIMEIDVFLENNHGLILAEAEFSSVEESASFQPPQWCSREVTGESQFNNSSLAS